MRSWNLAVLLSCMMVRNAAAVVIDDFEAGPLSRGPQTTSLELLQTGLPTSSVIGGEREWFALYDGSLDVNAQSSGELSLNHDRGIFEVAILKYGVLVDSSPSAPLNADFTAGGHSQITLRINLSQAAGAGSE